MTSQLSDPVIRGGRAVTRLVRPAPTALIVALVLALLLAGAMSLSPPEPVHAQEADLPVITLRPVLYDVPEGAAAVFRLTRTGDLSGDLNVTLLTLNPIAPGGLAENNPTREERSVRFRPGVSEVDVRVEAQRANSRTPGTMNGILVRGTDYEVDPDNPNTVIVALRERTDDDTIVSLEAVEGSIAEGDAAEFTVSRSGSTASSLTVRVETEDLDGAMQGNHWDPAPAEDDLLKNVTIPAGQSGATVSFATRPNVRDTGGLTLTASVVDDGGSTYWVSHDSRADVTVTDDDTAMEVSLSVDREEILEGESLTFTLTRHGDASEALEDAPFHLRIGPNIRRYLWPEYEERQDYAVDMAAGESARDLSFKVHHDRHRRNFRFRAEIKPASGIPEEHLDEYVSVRGERRVEAIVTNQAKQTVTFVSVGSGVNDTPYRVDRNWLLDEFFFEGRSVPFVMERSGPAAQIARELTVTVKYLELFHPDRRSRLFFRDYYNPSQQTIFVTFAAGETRANGEFFVAVDDVVEDMRGYGEDNYFSLWAVEVPLGDYDSDFGGYSVVRLVVQHVCIEGYSDLSLMWASSVVKRQFTHTASRLRLFCHASTSPRRVSLSGMRRSKHCRASTPISISAIFSQLPCLGV